MILNHINVVVGDVAGMTAFFKRHFDFKLIAMRGNNGFAILEGEGNVSLNLMKPGKYEAAAYPENFHVGFVVDSPATVERKHEELASSGCEIGVLQRLSRDGVDTVSFYCRTPGGLLVEVTAPA